MKLKPGDLVTNSTSKGIWLVVDDDPELRLVCLAKDRPTPVVTPGLVKFPLRPSEHDTFTFITNVNNIFLKILKEVQDET